MNVVFPCCANWETFVAVHKMFLNKIKNIFCVPDTKFVSATNVVRAGKRGNICVGNNVSATTCPNVARAFGKLLMTFIVHFGLKEREIYLLMVSKKNQTVLIKWVSLELSPKN